MFTVISMSRGCAVPCHKNPELSTEKLNELAWLVNEGALLAISSELLTEIMSTCSKLGADLHSERTRTIISLAERKGNLWFIDDLPIFVEQGIATDSFASIGTVVIQLFETENSKQWREYLRLGEFQANGNSVGVMRMGDVNRDILKQTKIIKEGESVDEVRRLLKVPMMWSQRIILYDQYALKNARASRFPNHDIISGLDRFLEYLVEVRRECDRPLDELTIVTHPSPRQGKDFVKKSELLVAMEEICSYHALHEWVEKVKLLFTKSKSEGERYIVFECSQSEKCFQFGVKGLTSMAAQNPGDPIKTQFVIKGPLQKEEWMPFKDKLKTFNEHVIGSIS